MSGREGGRFADLGPRVASATVLLAVGIAAVWAGGTWFLALVFVAVAAMVWELVRMLAPEAAPGVATAAGLATAVLVLGSSLWLSFSAALALILLPVFLGWFLLPRLQRVGAGYLALICLAGHAFVLLRVEFGLLWMVWLILLVIGSDVAGYFAGRFLGGPKFWPSVSPKKTWSGTVAGWGAGLVVGAAFVPLLGVGWGLLVFSLLAVLAGQMGDIAESALKRRAGVKDSSDLIPGHGGVMDRFDAMIGASVLFLVVAWLGMAGAVG